MTTRTVTVVTVGRSDFGIYLPVLNRIRREPGLRLRLVASGAHVSGLYGRTADAVREQGFAIDQEVHMLLADDHPEAVAQSLGIGVLGFAQAFAAERPELLLLLGDRFEMFAAAAAAVPLRIPTAHIHGGEVTHGAIDEAFRHSISKCSHLHFVSTREHGDRLVRMGEEPWRVTVSGAPSLDNVAAMELPSFAELAARYDLPDEPPVLVTFHPVTLQCDQVEAQVAELLAALESLTRPLVFTAPNADTYGRIVADRLRQFVAAEPRRRRYVENLGTRNYFGLMRHAAAMVGNSSSGIIEAASFELPVVNIGLRQSGRPASANVVHVADDRSEILTAIERVLEPSFRAGLRGLENIYGAGRAADVIVDTLRRTPLDARLIVKRFHDVAATPPTLHRPRARSA